MTAAVTRTRPFDNRDPDRLGFAWLVGIALHVITLFGISLTTPPQPISPTALAVTIAFTDSGQTPEEADFLAQHNQLGSGELAESEELTNDREADFSADHITAAEPIRPATLPEGAPDSAERPPVVASSSTWTTAEALQAAPGLSANVEEMPTLAATEVASLRAKLDHLRRDYSKAPRVLRVTSVSARAAEVAAYLDYWETVVEEVGNQHYPQEARRNQVFGSLRLAVTLFPDGTVAKVEVLQSSGHRVLDLAAIRTIRLAAPFAPFPPELAAWDRLEIIRTWLFEPGNRLRTSTTPW